MFCLFAKQISGEIFRNANVFFQHYFHPRPAAGPCQNFYQLPTAVDRNFGALFLKLSASPYNNPFVLGNCILDGLRFTAILIAFAKVLNIASIL